MAPAAVVAYNWSGAYIGASGGYGWGRYSYCTAENLT
jgi:hypothetical protein